MQDQDEIRIEAEDGVDEPLHNACTGGGCLPISARISRKVCVTCRCRMRRGEEGKSKKDGQETKKQSLE